MEAQLRLDEDGVFRGNARGFEFHLILDEGSDAPWRLLMTDPAERCFPVNGFRDLDEALDEMASCCDTPEGFSIALPCGMKFSRPGRLPAEAVMANLGYDLVGAAIAFLPFKVSIGAKAADARRAAAEILGRHSRFLGRVSLVDVEAAGSWWCADIRLPIGRYIHTSAYDAMLQRHLSDLRELVHSEFEIEVIGLASSGSAAVVPIERRRVGGQVAV